MQPPSPSQQRRVDACLASEFLPHSDLLTPYSEKGTVVHAFLEACAKVGREAALRAVPAEFRSACEVIDLGRLPPLDPASCAVEVAFAYDVDAGTSRETGRGISREQARALCGPREMPGIVDYLALSPTAVVVIDWKTGWANVDRAAANWQICSYGLAAARALGRDQAIVGIIRVLDNGSVWWDLATLDALDLDAAESQIRQLNARLAAAEAAYLAHGTLPRLVEGDHCRYCPALMHCHAKFDFVSALIPHGEHPPTALLKLVPEMTAEVAADLWPKLAIAKGIVERLIENVKAVARQRPVLLANGKVLAEVDEIKKPINAEKAIPLLEAKFGREFVAAVTQTKVTITKESLREVLRERVLPTIEEKKLRKISYLERDVLKELAAGGALNPVTYKKVEERAAELPAGDAEEAVS